MPLIYDIVVFCVCVILCYIKCFVKFNCVSFVCDDACHHAFVCLVLYDDDDDDDFFFRNEK